MNGSQTAKLFSSHFDNACIHSILYCLFILDSCRWSSASKAFIFSFYNVKGYNPVKLSQYQRQQFAMYSCSSYGPTFGRRHDIHISNDSINNQGSRTECGQTYSNPPGYSAGKCGFFTGNYYFTPSDIEVFYEISN